MVKTIEWTDAGVVMIDQRILPTEETYITCKNYLEVADAIQTMVIRGAPAGTQVINPAFDVTPNKYVTAIITEKGVARAPFTESLKELAQS